METLNGLGTIHHTYGIVYQNIFEGDDSCSGVTPLTGGVSPSLPSKRSFRTITLTETNDDIEPYYKKPKITHHDFETLEFLPPNSLSYHADRNTLWLLAKSIFPTEVPNWSGWNCFISKDSSSKSRQASLILCS